MMTLFVCTVSYIYVVNGLKCSPALGLCSVATSAVVAYTTYRVLLSIACGKDTGNHPPRKVQEKSTADFKRQHEEKRDEKEIHSSPVGDGIKKPNVNDEATIERVKAECKTYMKKVIAPFFPESVKSDLLRLVDDYTNGIIRCTPIIIGEGAEKVPHAEYAPKTGCQTFAYVVIFSYLYSIKGIRKCYSNNKS